MMKVNTQAIKAAAKELARIAFFGAISALLSYAGTKAASLPPDSAYAVILAIVLKVADHWVHKNDNIKLEGLSPFN